MRSHPVLGGSLLVLSALLFAAGVLGSWAPDTLPGPLPAAIIVPFVLWQLAVWALLFGFFFLRSRGPKPAPPERATP